MASTLLSSPIIAMVNVEGETSMIDARKMLATCMTRLQVSVSGVETFMRIISRRRELSGRSSLTEWTGSSLRS